MVLKFTVGPMECNSYIVGCESSGEAVIIDPGADAGKIKSALKSNNLKPLFIINTHGHGDHIGANGAFGLPILIHRLDASCLTDPVKNLSAAFFFNISSPKASRLLDDGDTVEFGDCRLSVIHTPGHTPGSLSLKFENSIFTGDTLFCGGIGRTDLPGGSEREILKSIREKLLVFADDVKIYPGHGPESTIGEERRGNPFL